MPLPITCRYRQNTLSICQNCFIHNYKLTNHGKADISSFQCRSIVSAITSDSHNFPVGANVAIDDAIHQCELVSGR